MQESNPSGLRYLLQLCSAMPYKPSRVSKHLDIAFLEARVFMVSKHLTLCSNLASFDFLRRDYRRRY